MALKEMLKQREPAELQAQVKAQLKKEENKPGSLQADMQEEGVWTLTVRLPLSLVRRVQAVATARKSSRVKPSTQQEIIREAIERWLAEEE